MPIYVKAGLLSNILSNPASASTNPEQNQPLPDLSSNSQNMLLLEPNISLPSVIQDKQDKKSTNKNNGDIGVVDESAIITIVSQNALAPATSPLGVSDGKDIQEFSPDQIYVYVVRKGDTVSQIANMFNVSSNTILWANDLSKNTKLVVGDTLIILPVSGLEHTVTKGQTVSSIAKLYKVDIRDITDYNGISVDEKLVIGQKFIIPGAELETKVETKPIKKSAPSVYVNNSGSSGYFIRPIPCGLTQGIHDKYAVDMSCGPSGTPIKAAASGRVIFAKVGWNGAYGNLTIIQHDNGTQTYYAHQSKLAVSAGDYVNQGEVIGYVGSTGRSTGPHLHFEVRGAPNPFR